MGLGVLALAYITIGFKSLVIDENGASDLHYRWVDQSYVAKGRNPYAVYLANRDGAGLSPDETTRIDPDIGPVEAIGNPPWTLTIMDAFVLPASWSVTRVYFAVLNALAIILIGVGVYRLGRTVDPETGLICLTASFAISATAITLRHGQVSILILLALAANAYFLWRRRQVLAGLCFAIAMVKPHISLLFGLIAIVRRDWICVLSAGVVLIVASLVAGVRVGTSPVELLRQAVAGARDWESLMYVGLFDFLREFGVDISTVVTIGVATGLLATFGILLALKDRNLILMMAVCATITLVWTYTRRYDQVLLVFLLLGLAIAAAKSGKRLLWITFGIVGATLWFPVTERIWTGGFAIVANLIWIGGLLILLRYKRYVQFPLTHGGTQE
ncbi:MAG: glycosyltransferase family 87 protein [Pseudomonadales bacterium]